MRRVTPAFLVVLTSVSLAGAEEPPYKRLLQGDDARKAAALGKQIYELWFAGKFEDAEAPAEELLALRKRVQGEKHWETADAARMVGLLHTAAGLSAEKRAVLVDSYSLNGRAQALEAHGNFKEAEPLLRQAAAARQEALGPRHPETATACHNLGFNLWKQGRAREAEALFRQALAIREQALGHKHPETARSCNNLAYNLQELGRAREAEGLYRQALAVYEDLLGPKDSNTAMAYDNLAGNLDAQGRTREAEPLFRKALAIYEDRLGLKHP